VGGRLSVFLGSILIGEIGLRFRVAPLGAQVSEREPQAPTTARPYRKIFPSYAHADTAIVEQFERYAASVGDSYLRDVTTLRSGEVWDERLGELIAEADVFQLFWSTRSMISPFVRTEWERALALERRHFIRPVYWEDPLPENPAQGLPPPELGRLHFQRIAWVTTPPASAVATETPTKAPPPKTAVGTSPGPADQTVLDVPPPEAIPIWPPEPVPSPAPAKRPPEKKAKESIHSKLGRVRRARVHIAYEVETYGATAHVELPFVIGVLADLSGHTLAPRRALSDRQLIRIDRDNFDHVLKDIKPRLALSLQNRSSEEGEYSVDLAFETLEDFRPAALARRLAETAPDSGVPEHLASLVNRVLHHTDFQRLESAWRGLHYLVSHCETGAQLKLRVLDVSKAELAESLRRFKGAARDRSPLYRLLHDREYEHLGGEPYGLLVADYPFDHRPPDVELLGELGMIGSAIHAPVVAALAPSVLGLAGWEALATVADVARLLDSDDHAGWRFLRESEPSRFICLTLPRVLARLPYGPRTHPVDEAAFEEDVSGLGLGGYVWMNAAYVMAVNVARAFSRDGWSVRIRGVEGGGAADDLPRYAFEATPGQLGSTRSVEVLTDDRREFELAESGFNVLIQSARGATPAFLSAHTLQKPAKHDDQPANVSAHLGVRLPYLLVLCRFAQHMRCMIRDSASVPTETVDLERWLNRWLSGYVATGQPGMAKVDSRRPLLGARVRLEQATGQPRLVNAKLRLQPGYELEGFGAWLEIDFQLPRP
jgi:type VI secretion system protein ImpC